MTYAEKLAEEYCRNGIVVSVAGIEALIGEVIEACAVKALEAYVEMRPVLEERKAIAARIRSLATTDKP